MAATSATRRKSAAIFIVKVGGRSGATDAVGWIEKRIGYLTPIDDVRFVLIDEIWKEG